MNNEALFRDKESLGLSFPIILFAIIRRGMFFSLLFIFLLP